MGICFTRHMDPKNKFYFQYVRNNCINQLDGLRTNIFYARIEYDQ